ncbi:hypothetical protein E4U42_003641 [Claviceps africana]|uniref:Uncharacterized protein n=1 Tax=Claviceps africana TaxID=83212 RepID=A0A8K0JI58_9HYPO|nr:hypothetical protein E4U42_003641 [Claviceps africana]
MILRLSLRLGRTGLGSQGRRCISYDKAALTNEALQKQVEAGLDDGGNREMISVDHESKTISTAAGELPISPLFDADWMKARRRQRKDEAGKPTGRFRRKLANNPYAQALATPIRRCPRTATMIPRYFLQDFELVKHPSTDALWWAPGPLSFQGLQTKSTSSTSSASASTDVPPRNRSPITGYIMSRKAIVDRLVASNKKHAAALTAMRTGMALGPEVFSAVWREDMGNLLLKMMRCHATDALITLSVQREQEAHQNIQPCKWEEVGDVRLRGCVLWLRGEDEAAVQMATLKVEGAKYGQTIAVHDLKWLLGESEAQRLRSESQMFQDHNVLVLRQEKNKYMMGLHLLLWRLQGYLASLTN